MSSTPYVTIGKIGTTYGIHGWLKIYSYTEPHANIFHYSPWLLKTDEQWLPIVLEEKKIHDHRHLIVKFPGIHTPEAAKLFTGKLIAVRREQLPQLKKNEFYWSDLKGLTVINKQGKILGKVIYLIATGANDVLVVKGTQDIAIPYLLNKVILNINLDKKEIHVDWE